MSIPLPGRDIYNEWRRLSASSSGGAHETRRGPKLSNELIYKPAVELVHLIRSRAISPIEVIEAYLRRIDEFNPALNAIVTVADDVLERARAAEAAVVSGQPLGLLHGLPLTVKDTIDTAELRTTSGSLLRADYIPSEDAAVVAQLKAAGAIILGKTNTPEMAIPYETDNPVFGRTSNPYNLKKTPGGSSGGEAAAIAAGLSAAGIGSDLSGSIRVPAHFCGIVGLKPTIGRVSMDGHLPAAIGPLSLGACMGPMARTVSDVKLLFEVLTGKPAVESRDLRSVRIAMYEDDAVPVSSETRGVLLATASVLREAGFEIDRVGPPAVSEGTRLWVDLFSRAAAKQIGDFYKGREDEAGPVVYSVLTAEDEDTDMPAKIDRAETLARALVKRQHLREELLSWMKTTPLILAPVGAVQAFSHGAARLVVEGESISVFRAFSYAQTFNVFGLPAVSVPAGHSSEGLPIGVQIAGRPNEENLVLSVARAIEEAFGGWRPPPSP